VFGRLHLTWNVISFQNEAFCPPQPSCFRGQMLELTSELHHSLNCSELAHTAQKGRAPSFLLKPRYCIKRCGLGEFQREGGSGELENLAGEDIWATGSILGALGVPRSQCEQTELSSPLIKQAVLFSSLPL
jgi:hypothetical protein